MATTYLKWTMVDDVRQPTQNCNWLLWQEVSQCHITSHDITWHYMLLVHILCVSCPKLCLSGVKWSVGTSLSQ